MRKLARRSLVALALMLSARYATALDAQLLPQLRATAARLGAAVLYMDRVATQYSHLPYPTGAERDVQELLSLMRTRARQLEEQLAQRLPDGPAVEDLAAQLTVMADAVCHQLAAPPARGLARVLGGHPQAAGRLVDSIASLVFRGGMVPRAALARRRIAQPRGVLAGPAAQSAAGGPR